MYAIMSKMVKTLCREIDYVKPGENSDELMRIYTTDINASNLQEVSDELLYKSLTDKRMIELQERNKIWEDNFKRRQLTSYSVIKSDCDWQDFGHTNRHIFSEELLSELQLWLVVLWSYPYLQNQHFYL